jgi:Ca-activated chloride channel family protein
MMRRPEKHFWYFVVMLSAVMLLGVSGQFISCANAHPPDLAGRHHSHVEPQPAPAPWNEPGPTVTSGPGVGLSAHVDRGAILQHGDGIVRVEVEVTAPHDSSGVVERSSDILVVVDTSGSMSGQKMHYSKQALMALVDRLGPEDRFGLIEYNSSAKTLVPLQHATEGQKTRFRAAAQGLRASGNTNMSEGLDQAIRVMQRQAHLGRPGRVLLLSDGLANEGDPSAQGLTGRARTLSYSDVPLTTMGIGEDFDEDLMTQLATAGTGAFYYLSRLGYLAQFFDAELSNTRETYARGAEIFFHPASGVSLQSAMGLPVQYRGGAQVIRLGSLYAGRTRTVWLTLRAPAHRLGMLALGDLSVGYERHGQPATVTVGALPQIACSSDYHRFQREIRQDVWERALLGDVFTTTEERFGDAIRSGSRRELHSALEDAEEARKLASSLGNQKVIAKLDELQEQAQEAERAQQAPAPQRNISAKKSKARGYQQRNKDSFLDSNAAMNAYR